MYETINAIIFTRQSFLPLYAFFVLMFYHAVSALVQHSSAPASLLVNFGIFHRGHMYTGRPKNMVTNSNILLGRL